MTDQISMNRESTGVTKAVYGAPIMHRGAKTITKKKKTLFLAFYPTVERVLTFIDLLNTFLKRSFMYVCMYLFIFVQVWVDIDYKYRPHTYIKYNLVQKRQKIIIKNNCDMN